jgi:hypothetical protein
MEGIFYFPSDVCSGGPVDINIPLSCLELHCTGHDYYMASFPQYIDCDFYKAESSYET